MKGNITSKNGKATRKDVADLAGVSEATVSFAMSGRRYVSDELKQRVFSAAEKLSYYPDMIARAMSEKKTNSIAVLTNDLTSLLQMKIIKSIEEAAMAKGFFVNICGGTMKLDRYVNNLISRHIDGVFLAGDPYAITGAHMNLLLENNISVILGSVTNNMDTRLCGVGIDFDKGMRIILKHLAGLGHTDIAYLSAFDETQKGDVRLSAFCKHASELTGRNPIVITGEPPFYSTVASGRTLANRLIQSGRSFTAVICANDMMAFGAINALQKSGYRVPEDVSVVGIDDIIFSDDFYLALTTLSHKSELFGKRVFEILYDNINDKANVQREVIVPELIVRTTTAPPKI